MWFVASLHLLVCSFKDVGLAWVVLAFDASNNPVAGGDDMTTLKGFDPTVSKLLWVMREERSYGRMIAMIEPLRGLNDHGFLSEFHINLHIKNSVSPTTMPASIATPTARMA